MTATLSAFPADGFTARWRRWQNDGDQTLSLRWENEGWTATGELTFERASYVVRLSPTWQVRQFLLFRDLAEPDLWLGTDGQGRWGEMNGAHRTDLDGCTDLHIEHTPFTATIPIRRVRLQVGDSVELRAANIDVETLGVVPHRQRYERLAPRRWTRTHLDHDPDAPPRTEEFTTDEYGLVHDLPQRFRRS